jgi:hypothetical protein
LRAAPVCFKKAILGGIAMKGKCSLVLCCVLCGILCAGLTAGCGSSDADITFVGTVEAVNDGALLVSTNDDVGFDRASVHFAPGAEPDFDPAVGQLLRITILPEVAESYPVQVTATAVELIADIEPSSDGIANVSMAAADGSVTPAGLTLVITDTNEQPYTYGEWYELQAESDGAWTKVPYLNDDGAYFTDIGLVPDADGVLTIDVDWKLRYGELAPGVYRIVKSLYFEDGYRYLYTEFTIQAENEKPAESVGITAPAASAGPGK